MSNMSSSRSSQPSSQYLSSQGTRSPNGSTMNNDDDKLTDEANNSSIDGNVRGHLISFNAILDKNSDYEYILPKGSHFYFDPYKPEECIIVCLSCSFKKMLTDCKNLEKNHVKTVLNKLLNEKGIPDVGVCVIVTENHTAIEGETSDSTTKDITLKIGIPINVSARGVTEHDIMTVLTDHLSPEGYKIHAMELIGTLVSSGLVTLKKSETDDIKLISKGTEFTFYNYASTELNQQLFLTTIDKAYPLAFHAHDSTLPEWHHYTSQDAIKLFEDLDYHMIVIQLTYFFKQDLSHSKETAPQTIAEYLKNIMKSSDFQTFSVITNFESEAAAYTAGPPSRSQPQYPLWIGVNVWLFKKGMKVPNVQQHVGTYFKDKDPKFKVLPQVPAPGITWPQIDVTIPSYPILPPQESAYQ